MDYILLIIGFAVLIKGADMFVDGSVIISEHYGISPFVIGLTVVAMGTSAPEAAVSITAALDGSNGIAVGNVLGSNLFNLLMVLGICALFKPLPVSRHILKTEYPISIVAAILVPFLASSFFSDFENLGLDRVDGIILLICFTVFILFTVISAKKADPQITESENINSTVDPAKNNRPADHAKKSRKFLKGIILAVIGVAGVIAGGKLVVYTATNIAEDFGISQTLIGLTIVAIGTSLPELVTSIVAAIKGETDIAVGNVIGSNIFNILFVLGISVVVNPISVEAVSICDGIILVAVSLIAMIPAASQREIRRPWGIIFIAIYAAYTAYIILR